MVLILRKPTVVLLVCELEKVETTGLEVELFTQKVGIICKAGMP
jgi:hypothetical protein